jgi:Contractile injection system tube protein
MSTFPNSPRLMKGALIGIDLVGAPPTVILFQYNPDTVTRTLQANASDTEGGNRSEPMRLKGAPTETLKIDVEIDATDQLENGNVTAISLGIHPQLAALEMLLYPKSALVVANTILAAVGTIEVIPPEALFTLLVWGTQRVLPVRVTEFSITEEAHDVNLNPIRAKVSLGLRVLSYNDLPFTHPGYSIFMTHQIMKETLANVGSAGSSIASVGVNLPI